MAKKKAMYEERIRYVENWNGNGEYFLFEGKWSNEEEWGLDTAFKCLDYHGEKGAVVSYQALTKIRELQRMGVPVSFC